MAAEENKTISRRLQEEVFGQGNVELVGELLAHDYISHAPSAPEQRRGAEDIKEVCLADPPLREGGKHSSRPKPTTRRRRTRPSASPDSRTRRFGELQS